MKRVTQPPSCRVAVDQEKRHLPSLFSQNNVNRSHVQPQLRRSSGLARRANTAVVSSVDRPIMSAIPSFPTSFGHRIDSTRTYIPSSDPRITTIQIPVTATAQPFNNNKFNLQTLTQPSSSRQVSPYSSCQIKTEADKNQHESYSPQSLPKSIKSKAAALQSSSNFPQPSFPFQNSLSNAPWRKDASSCYQDDFYSSATTPQLAESETAKPQYSSSFLQKSSTPQACLAYAPWRKTRVSQNQNTFTTTAEVGKTKAPQHPSSSLQHSFTPQVCLAISPWRKQTTSQNQNRFNFSTTVAQMDESETPQIPSSSLQPISQSKTGLANAPWRALAMSQNPDECDSLLRDYAESETPPHSPNYF